MGARGRGAGTEEEPALTRHSELTRLTGAALLTAACFFGAGLLHAHDTAAETILQRTVAGRFVGLGMTDAPRAWKSAHARDRKFIYLLDSVTGRIEICSDMEGVCRSVAASEREANGTAHGRFGALGVTPAPPAWRSRHPSDAHVIYSFDSATARIQVCGDMEESCAFVSSGHGVAADRWPKIVMLYRRADSAAIAGRIYDRLTAHFGTGAVFMDIHDIPFATDWREHVRDMSLHGGVVVALIGPRWLGKEPGGHVRIDDADDPVRTELETAFGANVPVFPVLVEGAIMPREAELPDRLKKLANINAAMVDVGRDFDLHMARLIDALDRLLARRAAETASK